MAVALRACLLAVLVPLFVLIPIAADFALAQGIQTSPYSAPSVLRGGQGAGLDLAPSDPLGLPGSANRGQAGSDTVSLSSGMFPGILPLIPNLQLGYLYNFGPNVRSGRFTADYLLPYSLSRESTVFGEAHTEFQSFWHTSSFNNRVDISLGGGYRTILRRDTLLGVNGFYDTSRLGGTWYSSGSVGFQVAALVGGSDAIDLNFNWYGKLFNSTVIQNAFRYGPSNFDFQAGYSHELWNGGPDLRLSATGYKFEAGNSVYGWNAQAELKTRDNVLALRYNVGHDKINQTYQTVGGFVNVGFHVENLVKGESPFSMPEPIFKSPRNLWYMLTQTVTRNWYQPSAVVTSWMNANRPAATAGCSLGTYVINSAGSITSVTFYTTTPSIPDALSGGAVTLVLKWCGVNTGATLTSILIRGNGGGVPTDDIILASIAPQDISGSGGTLTIAAAGGGRRHDRTQTNTVNMTLSAPITFDAGGGISVEWH